MVHSSRFYYEGNFMKEKKINGGLWIRKILFCISCILLFWSCYELYNIFSEYKKGTEEYENIRDVVKNETPTWTKPTQEDVSEESSEQESETKKEVIGLEDIDMSAYEVQGSIQASPTYKLLDLVAIRYNLIDFDSLCAINSDVVGWITIEGTNIDYPVVQGEDNTYYLRKTITGEFNIAGSIFVDYLVENPFYSENTLIHGHNQKNNAMFHYLSYYVDKDYFDSHRYILIYLPNGKCVTYEIYSFYISESVSVTFDCTYTGNEYQQYLNYSLENSWYDTGVNLTTADKIITLSTCTNGVDDGRYIVHARKIS